MPSKTETNIKESKTDVLIIGAGPSGLMCALWLSRCGIPFRIIDKRSNEIFAGQADGLQSRSLEIFKSFSESQFDFITMDQAWKCANHIEEMCFWSPNENEELIRKSRISDNIPGLSNFTECVINQGNIEKWFVESIKQFSGNKVEIERPLLPLNLKINDDNEGEYPVEILVKRLSNEKAKPEQFGGTSNGLFRQFDGDQEKSYSNIQDSNDLELIKAKYVLGSDGAHSWVRKQLNINMEGEHTDFVWGVMDIVPITNFPDIRSRCAVHSKDSGSMMIIPRENDLVRFYIQLKEVDRDVSTKDETREFMGNCDDKLASSKGRIDRSKITPESILKQAQEIIKPYTLEICNLNWYTGYQIGQRVANKFEKHNRVFISGDACHTHSPKAGQGMNVSMQDTYNLGFKLALVCKGLADPKILNTYESERIKIAKDLIDFDHKFSKLFSGQPMIPNSKIMEQTNEELSNDRVDMNEFHQVYLKGSKFASGTIVDYEDSILINKSIKVFSNENGDFNSLASKVPIGRRLYSDLILGQVDLKTQQIEDKLTSDGRFRVIIFSGNLKHNPINFEKLNNFNSFFNSTNHFLKKYTPKFAFENSVIEILLIHSNKRNEIEFNEFPEFLRPIDFKRRTDYWKIYSGVDSNHLGQKIDIYETYGIDKDKGAILVIRPDTHVAKVVEFSESGLNEIDEYFDVFMIDQRNNEFLEKDVEKDDSDRFVKPRLAV
ncbi:uncharacterized protein KGF55_003690 [Candida pseudojiufengensis]|uniref:uncharacterized protein n=1 Tax=Candida pseudojiufengensis TaxID=497109 RepID=UPI00222542AA|nr:uncharacterized protein KGF55_003690 [Candida pseudojiufengensis]KAI5962614.1 hypothetical protein KGF55_003690 [Candida pseudojiufengensis]